MEEQQKPKNIPKNLESLIEKLPTLNVEQQKQVISLLRKIALRDKAVLEQDWKTWITSLFPKYCFYDFSEAHCAIHDWGWSLKKGEQSRPIVIILNRGGAKSTSLELLITYVAARQTRRYAWYICHEKGTPVLIPGSDKWILVEDHPSARIRRTDGYEVKVWGLPFTEVVTAEHRYWTRTIKRKDRGHGRPPVHSVGTSDWKEAQNLTNEDWIGYPVDQTIASLQPIKKWNKDSRSYEETIPTEFLDPEWWKLFGLWWGDGSIGGREEGQISLYIGSKQTETLTWVKNLLERYGKHWSIRPKKGCEHLSFCDRALGRWLHSWSTGNSRKVPPFWVEKIEHKFQSELIKGYVEADGYISSRAVNIKSIHLDGLLCARRILSRLGIAASIKKATDAGCNIIQGRTYDVQPTYVLWFAKNADLLGYRLPEFLDAFAYNKMSVEDGMFWSRIKSKVPVSDREFVPITTETGDYITAFGKSHNCRTQDQADVHVGNVGTMIESSALEYYYPDLATRKVGKYGAAKAWRRNRIWTDSGFVIDALGLDTAMRGVKLDYQRPDLIILDDMDEETDSEGMVSKMIDTITRAILPAGSEDVAIAFAQNLVHRRSIASKLIDPEYSDMLTDRIRIGPVPAVRNLKTVKEGTKDIIVSGIPTWDGMNLQVCQQMINREGLRAFKIERQHDVTISNLGCLFSEFNETYHVITQREFQRYFGEFATAEDGSFKLPDEGNCGMAQDYGCLTMDTEILTQEGWKTHDQINIGEYVAGYDWHDSRKIVWTPLLNKVYKKSEPLVEMSSKSFKFVCTPDHCWIVQRKKRGRMIRDTYRRQPLDSLGKNVNFQITGICEQDNLKCDPSIAGILGWIVTDGWVQGHQAYICQKNYAQDVLIALEQSGIEWDEMTPKKWGVRIFRIKKDSFDKIKRITGFKSKEDLPRIAAALSPKAREKMLEAFLLAEGTTGTKTRKKTVFCQNKGYVADAFQILAALSGYRLGVQRKHYSQSGYSYRIPMILNKSVNKRKLKIKKLSGLYDVWCPTVAEGAIIARQNGQVCITGNSTIKHPCGSVWAWAPSENLQMRFREIKGAVFIYRELVRPTYPQPENPPVPVSPGRIAKLIKKREKRFKEGARMKPRLFSHEQSAALNTYLMDLKPEYRITFTKWTPDRRAGIAQIQNYLEIDYTQTSPFRRDPETGQLILGRTRLYFVVANNQGELYRDDDGRLQVRQPTDEHGSARLRAEIVVYNLPTAEDGTEKHLPPKQFDDVMDPLKALANVFFPPLAKKTKEQKQEDKLPESLRIESICAIEDLNQRAEMWQARQIEIDSMNRKDLKKTMKFGYKGARRPYRRRYA